MKKTCSLWSKAVMICLLGTLSACSVLPQAPSRDNYRLPVTSLKAPAGAPVQLDRSVQILTPHSGRLLDGLRILVIRQHNQINVYKGAQWSDPAPVLIRDRILEAFRIDGRISSLSHDTGSVTSDLALHSDLRSFQIEYRDHIPYAIIQLDASLITPAATRRPVATRYFSITVPADGEQVPQIVNALGAATDKLAADIVNWTWREAQSRQIK